jgi:hypothetical protein
MRGSLSRARLLTAALAALVLAVSIVASASATIGTTSANGISVTASLSPDTVSKGQTVTQSASVKNTSDATESLAISIAGALPSGAPSTFSVSLKPNATFARSTAFPAAQLKAGKHTLTVTAVNRQTGGAAQATASVTAS